MKPSTRFLSLLLAVCLLAGLLILPASAATYYRTMNLGDTATLYHNSGEAVKSAAWTSTDPYSVQIESQNSVSCRIKVIGPSVGSYVIVQCRYNYIDYMGGYAYLREGITDYRITVNASRNLTAYFDANGGSPSTTKNVKYGDDYGYLPSVSRDGYSFAGWYYNGSRITSGTRVTATSDHTVYARWNVQSYSVTFDANGGTTPTASKTVTYDSRYGTLPMPTREGYDFDGWYTAKEGGTKVTENTTVSTGYNHTLYAGWSRKAQPLTIVTQPKSVTVEKGAVAKVTVEATGEGLSYRWYYKDQGASDYVYTSAFKGNTYQVEMTAARNGRRVLCRVYDKQGNAVQSSSALLSMKAEQKNTVKITAQPQSVTVAKGAVAKVTVKASGDGLTYRWYYKNAGESDYTYTSSFKGNTYQVEMTAARNGRRVLCKVYDKYGNMVQSNSALLSMKSTVKITGQPQSVTVAEGATAKVTVKATGDGLTYRWYYKNAGESDYTYTSSFKGNTYQVEMTAARNGRRVLCKVYDKYGNTVQSSSALLKMK